METTALKPWPGHCACGAVQYLAGGPSLFCAHCHCRYCRSAHGAAFVTWVGISDEHFGISAGAEQLCWYQSSEQSRRGFCGHCGTTLFFASTLCPGEMHVTRSSLVGEIDREPQCHVFYEQHVGWAGSSDELPRYTSEHAGLAKYRVVPP